MEEKLKPIFLNRKPEPIEPLRKASVLILLEKINNDYYVIFEVRSSKLKTQPLDICLPGGKMEEGESSKDAALRETYEELNILLEKMKYVGESDYLLSPYGMVVYAHVATIDKIDTEPNASEVDHIFKVPLDFFMKTKPLLYKMPIGSTSTKDFPFELINNGKNYKFRTGILNEYFYIYEGYTIWGFTAAIIKKFVDIYKSEI